MKKEHENIIQAFDNDLDMVVHCAFRYFMGRTSAATYSFIQSLKVCFKDLEPQTKKMLARELGTEIERDIRARTQYRQGLRKVDVFPLGHTIDRKSWDELHLVMCEELSKAPQD